MTLERRVASKARELVLEQKQQTKDHKDETKYRSVCEGLPILLRNSGLLQAVSFLEAKRGGDKAVGSVYGDLETQLKELGFLGSTGLTAKVADSKLTTPQYRFLSEMAMLVAFWHKRMAQALLRQAEKPPEPKA